MADLRKVSHTSSIVKPPLAPINLRVSAPLHPVVLLSPLQVSVLRMLRVLRVLRVLGTLLRVLRELRVLCGLRVLRVLCLLSVPANPAALLGPL